MKIKLTILPLLFLLTALSSQAQFIRFESTDYKITPNRLLASNILGEGIQIIQTNGSRIILRALANGETNTLASVGTGKSIVAPKVGAELRLRSFGDSDSMAWSTNATSIVASIKGNAYATNLFLFPNAEPALELWSGSDPKSVMIIHNALNAFPIEPDGPIHFATETSEGFGSLQLSDGGDVRHVYFGKTNNIIWGNLAIGTNDQSFTIPTTTGPHPAGFPAKLFVYQDQTTTSGAKEGIRIQNGGGQTNNFLVAYNGSTNVFEVNSNGIVTLGGDGTASLHAVTLQQMQAYVTAGTNALNLANYAKKIETSAVTNQGPMTLNGGLTNSGPTKLANNVVVDGNAVNSTVSFVDSDGTSLYRTITDTGTSLEIANTEPGGNLGLIGANGSGYAVYFGTGDGTIGLRYNASVPNIQLLPAGGRVGVATNDPQASLHVHGHSIIASNETVGGNVTIGGGLTNTGATLLGPMLVTSGGTKRFNVNSDGSIDWGSVAANGKLSWDTTKAIIYGQSGMDLSLGAGGTVDLVYLKPTGNFGIGETAPGSKLSVSGNATIGASYDTTAAPANGLLVEGNVGIGTNSAQTKLHVVSIGTGSDEILIRAQGGGSTAFPAIQVDRPSTTRSATMRFSTGGVDDWVTGTMYNSGGTDSGYGIGTSMTLGSATKMYVSSTGNVGIGTTTPFAKLTVKDAGSGFVNIGQLTGSSANSGITFSTTTSTNVQLANYSILGDGANTFLGRPSGGDMFFREANSSQMILKTSTGRLGIGTETPSEKLHVVGSAIVTNQITATSLRLNETYGAGASTAFLVSGVSKGIRIGVNASQGNIEGVDNTGSASYQPLQLGGSTTALGVSGIPKLTIAADGQITIATNVSAAGFLIANPLGGLANILGKPMPLGPGGLTNISLTYPRRFHVLTTNETISIDSSTNTHSVVQIMLYSDNAGPSRLVTWNTNHWYANSGGGSPITIASNAWTLLILQSVTNKIHIDWSGVNTNSGSGTLSAITGPATNITVYPSNTTTVPLTVQPTPGTTANSFQVNYTNGTQTLSVSNQLTTVDLLYVRSNLFTDLKTPPVANGTNFIFDANYRTYRLLDTEITNVIWIRHMTNGVTGKAHRLTFTIRTGPTNRMLYLPTGWWRADTNVPIILSSNSAYYYNIQAEGPLETDVFINPVSTKLTSQPLLVLDQAPANVWGAYSYTRKLRRDYSGYAFRVNPAGDYGTFYDVGYTPNGLVDTNGLLAYLAAVRVTNSAGGTFGTISITYDNSTNGNNLTRDGNANIYPLIVYDSNAVNVLPGTGYPAANFFVGPDTGVFLTNLTASLNQPITVYWVGAITNNQPNLAYFDGGAGTGLTKLTQGGNPGDLWVNAGTADVGPITFTLNTRLLVTSTFNGASSAIKKNNGVAVTGNAGTADPDGFLLGGGGNSASKSFVSEVIIYSSAHADGGADQTTVINNINGFYSIW